MNHMVDTRIRESNEKKTLVLDTIDQMAAAGEKIDFSTVAKKAGVSRVFLYRHEDIKTLIWALRLQKMSKEELRKEAVRLRLQIEHARRVLAGERSDGLYDEEK